MKGKLEQGSFLMGYIICGLLVLVFSAGVLALLILVLNFSLVYALMSLAGLLGLGYVLASREPPAQDLQMHESVWNDEEDQTTV
jgi:hypothetical protein